MAHLYETLTREGDAQRAQMTTVGASLAQSGAVALRNEGMSNIIVSGVREYS